MCGIVHSGRFGLQTGHNYKKLHFRLETLYFMKLVEIDSITMKSGIRRFLGALMRCSECIFGDFRAKLSRVLQNLVILQSYLFDLILLRNRLKTSHESSQKPSDSTLQRGEVCFDQFNKIQCLQTKM